MEFSARLLDFPVRTAAIASFLADLKARGIGDVSSLQAVIGDSSLWGELSGFWIDRGWVRPAPHSPIHVFPGESFDSELTLREFCGEDAESGAGERASE